MRNVMTSVALAAALVCASPGQAASPQKSGQALEEAKADAKSGPGAKLSTGLLALKRAQTLQANGLTRDQHPKLPRMVRTSGGYVSVSAYGNDPAALRTQLVSKGMLDAKVHEHSVSGRVPVASLGDMAGASGLTFMKSVSAITQAGLVTSQGDHAMRTDLAREQLGVNGRGVRVGVLSDSYDCAPGAFASGQHFTRAADDVRNNDLPADIHVLSDLSSTPDPGCADEGRAMMQIIHDVAPGAALSFHTAFVSEEDFAQGILDLATDGAKVIVDDIIYFDEPMFENGIVADAVNTVKKQGVAYFSSAGNNERLAYQSQFRLSKEQGFDGLRNDFDAGRGVDTLQHVVIPGYADTGFILNWDEPSYSANGIRGSRSDVDLIFFNMDGEPIEDCAYATGETPICQFAGLTFNEGGDAVEIAEIINLTDTPIDAQVSIELYSGPAPNLIKYVWFDFGEPITVAEYDTRSGANYGHSNAEGAEAVGAAWWFDTAAWGAANHPQCNNACVNSYSSAGGTPLLFDEKGQRRPVPYIGFKPGVTGPDGGNTTFFYYNSTTPAPGGEPDEWPNFFGTSAAAPHVAAVAALLLDQRARDVVAHKHFSGPRDLTPDLIYTSLRSSAEDIRMRALLTRDPTATEPIPSSKGFDFDSGFGFVNAKRALQLIAGF